MPDTLAWLIFYRITYQIAVTVKEMQYAIFREIVLCECLKADNAGSDKYQNNKNLLKGIISFIFFFHKLYYRWGNIKNILNYKTFCHRVHREHREIKS